MEQLHFITKLLDIEDTNIKIIGVINRVTHKEIIAKLEATNNGSIIFVVGKSPMDIMEPIFV